MLKLSKCQINPFKTPVFRTAVQVFRKFTSFEGVKSLKKSLTYCLPLYYKKYFLTEKQNKKTTKVSLPSPPKGINPPSQTEKGDNPIPIIHFSARFHAKTRREIFQIRRLLLHFLPVSSSKPPKIGFNSRENRFSIPLAPQFFLFSSFRVSAKKGDLVHFVRG